MKVLAFGTFDILHPGHREYLREAKYYGDTLYVAIALDTTVEKVKGRPPLHSQEARKKAVEKIPFVDHAVLGYEGDKYRIIEEIKPDIIVLGYDQVAFTENIEKHLLERGMRVKIIRAKAYNPEEYKSSKLREQFTKGRDA